MIDPLDGEAEEVLARVGGRGDAERDSVHPGDGEGLEAVGWLGLEPHVVSPFSKRQLGGPTLALGVEAHNEYEAYRRSR